MPAAFAAPEIVRLMDCVTCRVDPALDAQYPAAWPARVEITLRDGRKLAAATQHAKGDPRNPLSLDEVIAKHRSIVAGIVNKGTDEAILDFILNVETKADFGELTCILKGFVVPREHNAGHAMISVPDAQTGLPQLADTVPQVFANSL